MPKGSRFFERLLRLACVAVLLAGAGLARADDYAEVQKLAQSGQSAQALARAEQYIAAHPADPQMRFIRGVILSQAGHEAQAREVFIRLTQEYPELAEPYNNLAVMYAADNQLDKARAALEMAVRNRPDYATAHENLGDIYVRLAAQSYRRAAELDPKNKALAPKLALVRQLLESGKPPAQSPAPPR